MRLVRLALVAVVSLCLVGNVAMAQEKKHRGPKKPDISKMMFARWDEMLKAVDLTVEQKTKWEALKKEYGPKIKDMFDKRDNILTAEQKKAIEEAAKAAQEAGKTGPEIGQAAQEAAKITDEQKAKFDKWQKGFETLRKEFRDKLMGLLTAEQKEMLPEPPQGGPGGQRPPKGE